MSDIGTPPRPRAEIGFLVKRGKRIRGLAVALLVGLAGPAAWAGSLVEVEGFGPNPGNLRMFEYVPDTVVDPAPLVVALHGCTQSASAYDDETGWAKLAEDWDFVLLLPEQKRSNNRTGCFQWFEPSETTRGQGEVRSIKQMIDKIVADHSIDLARVYVTGLSAGGGMTSAMLAAYPEVFAGGAVIAGLPYGCATGFAEATSCMFVGRDLSPAQWGDRVRRASAHAGPWPRVSVWHGSSDATVNPVNATELVEQWTDVHGIDPIPDLEDTVKGYPHRVYRDADGNALVEAYVITGMGHGTPVDPGPAEDQCGTPSAFILDVGICSSYYIARFWGLDKAELEAPVVQIVSPAEGAEVSGLVPVQAHAVDNLGVATVEFYVDENLRETDNTAPWEASWDTTAEFGGSHSLRAKAFDAEGNAGTSSPVSVTVTGGREDLTAPAVHLTAPTEGATVHGTVALAADASDNVAVARVEFLVDETLVGTGTPAAEGGSWESTWDTSTVADGEHRILVRAHDLTGNAQTEGVTVEVRNRSVVVAAVAFGSNDQDDGYVSAREDGSEPQTGHWFYEVWYGLAVGRGIDGKLSRAVLSFDTSGIPDDATLMRAVVTVRHSFDHGAPWDDPSGNELVVDVKKGCFGNCSTEPEDWAAPPTAAAVAEIPSFTGGDQSSAGFSPEGLAAINKTGITQLRLRFAENPTFASYLFIEDGPGATLHVEYED